MAPVFMQISLNARLNRLTRRSTAALSVQAAGHQPVHHRLHRLLVTFTLGLGLSWASGVAAQTPAGSGTVSPAPPELLETLTKIDAAASQGDLQTVMRFYSRNFTSTDGLTYETLGQVLEDLWKRYPNLTYQTTLDRWEQQGNGLSTVTTTRITGDYPDERRSLKLEATITSRQQFEENQIVAQEVLSERSELSAGDQPPTVTLNLPEQVTTSQQFDFDAVVQEPLGDRQLLGAAIEEPIATENYLNPAQIELELLPSGGLFKVGRAPATAGDQWVSAIIVRYDGITAVTQRLRVVDREPPR
jgi:hypothetical protein